MSAGFFIRENIMYNALAEQTYLNCEQAEFASIIPVKRKKTTVGKKALRKNKILVVEDNPVAQFAINHMLNELGCLCELATDANDALELVQNNPDIIFIDIGLPGDISGIKLTKKLRSLSITKNTPIVAITAHTELRYELLCHQAGMDGFYRKPRSCDEISQILLQHGINETIKA